MQPVTVGSFVCIINIIKFATGFSKLSWSLVWKGYYSYNSINMINAGRTEGSQGRFRADNHSV